VNGETWIIALVVAGVLNSALSLYYYLKVIRFMYLYDPEESEEIEFSNSIRYVSLLVIISLVVVLPLFYQDLFSLCENAATVLFP
jgi:NADH-quinone oxidoreductase subunit N